MALTPGPISEGTPGHLDDHATIHARLNNLPYVDAATEGVVADGSTDATAAFTAAVATAATASKPLLLQGDTRLGAGPTLTQPVRLKGTPGAKITIAAGGTGIEIRPEKVASGTVTATATGSTTLTVTGAGWATNAHAGKWAEVTDPALNPATGEGTVHVRRIKSNTADTLTLEYAIGYPIPAGTPLNLVTPLDEIDLEDITIDRSVLGNANLVISYVRNVKGRHLQVDDSGNYATTVGNAVSIYHADRVRIIDLTINRAGNFGLFIYNSDNVRVIRPVVNHWGGQFGIQLKDCRDALVIDGRGVGDGVKGDHFVNIKCSGLNPAFNVRAVNCSGVASKDSNFEMSSITAEGTLYSARHFRFSGCESRFAGGSGFAGVLDAGANTHNLVWQDCQSDESFTFGYSGNVLKRLQIINCGARRNRFEGIQVNVAGIRIFGGILEDNCQGYVSGASRSSEILLEAGAQRTLIEGVTFRRTSAGKALRALRELTGADNNLAKDCRITEEVAALSQDYLFVGTGSKAIGWHSVDSFTGTPTINKKAYTTAP